ncbi:MAG: hypothetical protein ACK5MR_17890, partial [Cumulibacter sp.]
MAGSSTTRGAHTLSINGDTYTFKYANGTLQDIEFPDGRKTQWLFNDYGGTGTNHRLTLTQEDGWWRSWLYGAESRQLISDDVWNYNIAPTAASGNPETETEPDGDALVMNRPLMERTRIASGEKQIIEYEANNSIEKTTDILGNITKTYSYKSHGILYGKTYKIERKLAGESTYEILWQASYDARRRLTHIKNADNDTLLRLVYGEQDQVLERYDAFDKKTTYEYELHLGVPLLKKVT